MITGNKNKILLFYWYIPSFGWHKLYDLHLSNLSRYKDRFDKKYFVLSYDDTTDLVKIIETKEKISSIIPDVVFQTYRNDKQLRESYYFYNEVANKLDNFGINDIIFFAHNKGISSTYLSNKELNMWINLMYYCNLEYIDKINEFINDETTCCIGTLCIKDWNPWHFYPLKNKWHYSGTFFWFIPLRLLKYIKEHNVLMPQNNRYFTEGFLGNILPYDINYVKTIFGCKKCGESMDKFLNRVFDNKEKEKYKEIYER